MILSTHSFPILGVLLSCYGPRVIIHDSNQTILDRDIFHGSANNPFGDTSPRYLSDRAWWKG